MMSKLLISERPLMIIPSLALKIGLNEAIILQQIHYWVQKSKHEHDGRKWVYNTYKEWQSQLPFWSESTIKRTIKSLQQQGYLLSANYNKSKLDQTKWYSIDYDKLAELEESALKKQEAHPQTEFETEEHADSENTVQTPDKNEQGNETNKTGEIPYTEIIHHLNNRTQSSYRDTTRKTRELIASRWKEGFTFEDFIKVIDLKTAEWLKDPTWSRYLRPETLFGTKFESYLNQKPVGRKLIREEDFDLDDEA